METLNKTILIPEDAAEHGKVITGNNKVGLRIPFGKYFTAAKKLASGRRSNPVAPNQADLVSWIIWDRITVAANATFAANYKFFTTPIGQSSKTKIDTNMTQVSRLEDPQWMNVTHLGIVLNPNIEQVDLNAILNNYYIEFWVGQKIYVEGPVQNFPGGVGASSGVATTATTTTLRTTSNGLPAVSNLYDMRLPAGLDLGDRATDGLTGINILQGQSFKVELNGTSFTTTNTGGSGVTMYCELHGILSRQVQ